MTGTKMNSIVTHADCHRARSTFVICSPVSVHHWPPVQ